MSFKSPSNSSGPISQEYGYSHSSQWPQDFFPSLIQTQQPQSRAVPWGPSDTSPVWCLQHFSLHIQTRHLYFMGQPGSQQEAHCQLTTHHRLLGWSSQQGMRPWGVSVPPSTAEASGDAPGSLFSSGVASFLVDS